MKPSTKKVVLIALIGAIVLLWFADEYPAMRFRGDGTFSGGPVFGYEIRLRSIPFYKSGEYVFHFRGMPNEEMSLQLYAEGKTDRDRAELTQLETTLDAQLLDGRGQAVCQATGMAREGQSERSWVLMSTVNAVAFWHWNCVHFQLKSSDVYTLTLRIRNVDPKTPRINLLPVLEGGQLDYP